MSFCLPAFPVCRVFNDSRIYVAEEYRTVPDRIPVPGPVIAITCISTDICNGMTCCRRIPIIHSTRHDPRFSFCISVPCFVAPIYRTPAPKEITRSFYRHITIAAIKESTYFIVIRKNICHG